MFNLDADLLGYLSEKDAPALLFARPDNIDRLQNSIPRLAASYVDGWSERTFWTTGELEKLGIKDGVAVCSSPFFGLPAVSAATLARAGIRTVLSLEDGKWREVKLGSTLAMLSGKSRSLVSSARRRSIVTLRKALLKKLGTDIRAVSTNGIAAEHGLGCFANVPTLKDYADAVTGAKQGILFFEEEKLLLPHQAHADIRERGLGRCSLWVENFYFSATDNSDPCSNGRRYRFIKTTPLIERLLSSLDTDAETVIARDSARAAEASTAEQGYALSKNLQAEFQAFVLGDNEALRAADAANRNGLILYLAQGDEPSRQDRAIVEALSQSGMTHSVLQEGIEIHPELTLSRLKSKRELKALGLLSALPLEIAGSVRALFSELITSRPAVLHTSGERAGVIGAISGLLAGVPKIYISVSKLNPSYVDPRNQELFKRWFQVIGLSPRVNWSADTKTAADSFVEWLELTPDRFCVLPLALPSGEIEPVSPEQIADVRRHAKAEAFSLLVAGVAPLTSEQRPFRFLRLIFALKAAVPGLRAVLVGDGPLKELCGKEIENLGLSETVTLLSGRDAAHAHLAAADVVVFTASPEVIPEALIEAMLRGKAVVCTDVGEARQLIEDGRSGCLCNPADFHSLRARTQDLIEHPEMRSAFGMNAERSMKEKIGASDFAAALAGLYRSEENVSFEGKKCA